MKNVRSSAPKIVVYGEARPNGERITKATLTFRGELPYLNSIQVKNHTIVDRSVEGKTITLVFDENEESSHVLVVDEAKRNTQKSNDGRPDIPPVKLRPIEIVVEIPGKGTYTTCEVREPVIEDFEQYFYDPFPYNLYIPKDQKADELYPLVVFIPDAGVNGEEAKIALAQGIGATVWAQEDWQEKHKCYVLAIQVTKRIHLTRDSSTVAEEFEVIKELIDKIVAENNIDTNRIYLTGQSQGCMASCELNLRYPDYFAASLLVSGQWSVEKMVELTNSKFFFGLSSGGPREFPIINEITNGLAAKGVTVNRIHLNYRDGWDVNNARVKAVAVNDAQVVYVVWDKETIFPDDGIERKRIAHHNRGWELTYQLEPAKEWLFAQSR